MDREIFKKYKVWWKPLSEKRLLECLNEIIMQKSEIRIVNVDGEICAYSILLECLPCEVISDDEEQPANIGCGWTIKEAIKSLLLSEDVLEYLYDDIRWILMSRLERFLYVIRG